MLLWTCTVPWEALASSGAARAGSGAGDGTGAGQSHLLRGLSSSPKPGNVSVTAMPGSRVTNAQAGLCSRLGGTSSLFESFTDLGGSLGLEQCRNSDSRCPKSLPQKCTDRTCQTTIEGCICTSIFRKAQQALLCIIP